MILLKAPATSANLGPGFDCFGLALDIYNTFEVEISDEDILENVEDRFNNKDNIFLQAYHLGCRELGVKDHIHAIFHCDIPVSRGLGSSASLIVGGLMACRVLHDNELTFDTIFQLASALEGHPDNAAPCLFGGFCACMKTDDRYITRKLNFHDSWNITALIPDFESSTLAARKTLPATYDRNIAASNTAHAVLMCEALENRDIRLLRKAAEDQFHEPYRKKLIPGYEKVKKIVTSDTDGVFLISGSGSACLVISHRPLSSEAIDRLNMIEGHHWEAYTVHPATDGFLVIEE